MTEQLLQAEAAYNEIYAAQARPVMDETLADALRTLDTPWHRALQGCLEDIRGLKVLEIACGMGACSAWLNGLQAGAETGGVWSADFSAEAVAATRKLLAHRFPAAEPRVIQADFQALPFENANFDVLISCETLEHLPDPDAGLREVWRVLKPGGRLYLTTENYLNLTGLYRLLEEKIRRRPWRSGSFVQPIEQFFCAPGVLSRLRRHGFTVADFDSCGYYFYLPRRPVPWDMALLSRSVLYRPLFRYLGRHLMVQAVKPE